jgi:hypothetical protein
VFQFFRKGLFCNDNSEQPDLPDGLGLPFPALEGYEAEGRDSAKSQGRCDIHSAF